MFRRERLGTSGPLDPDDRFGLRNWWHQVLRDYDRYETYAIFLLLPGDRELLRYLNDFSQELNVLSGENCLVLVIGRTDLQRSNVQESLSEEPEESTSASPEDVWLDVLHDHIGGGYSLRFAELFDVDYVDLPCLLIFESIHGADYLIVPLRDMDADGIARQMRVVFSAIQQAAAQSEDPLVSIKRQLYRDSLSKKGKTIASGLRVLVGETFQTAMEAWIKAMVG